MTFISSRFVLTYKKDGLYSGIYLEAASNALNSFLPILNDYLATGDLQKSVLTEVDFPSQNPFAFREKKNLTEEEWISSRHINLTVDDPQAMFDVVPLFEAFNFVLFDFDENRILIPDFEYFNEIGRSAELKATIEVEDLMGVYKHLLNTHGLYYPDYFRKFDKENAVISHCKLHQKSRGYSLFSEKFIYRDFSFNSTLHEETYYLCCTNFGTCSCDTQKLDQHEKNYLPF